jgi:hypothetical protein
MGLCFQADANRTARAAQAKYTPGIAMHNIDGYAVSGWVISLIAALFVIIIAAGVWALDKCPDTSPPPPASVSARTMREMAATGDAPDGTFASVFSAVYRSELPLALRSAVSIYR